MSMKLIHDKAVWELIDNDPSLPNLILDLDNTLIYTIDKYYDNNINNDNYDVKPFILSNKINDGLHRIIYKRQFVYIFLLQMKKLFNVYFYTNGTGTYGKTIYDMISSQIGCDIAKGIISRKDSMSSEKKYLNILPYFNKYNTIIIDDRTDVWESDVINNIIKIDPYIFGSVYTYISDRSLNVISKSILNNYNYYINNEGKKTFKIIDFVNIVKMEYHDY